MPGESTNDETCLSPKDYFKIKVYFVVLDAIIISLSTRFDESKEILKDLCLLSPHRILNYNTSVNKTLPGDIFKKLEDWLPGIDITILKNEYFTLSSSIKSLLDGLLIFPKQLHLNTSNKLNNTESSTDNDDNEDSSITSQQILKVLSNYGLDQTFPNLYLAYKGLLTIPASSASLFI